MAIICFATENPGKLKEVREFATIRGHTVLSPKEAGLTPVEVDETGDTYEENAILKVKAYLGQSAGRNLIICGDDTGVEIAALGSEPGIHTRRWLGYRMSDDEIIGYALGRLHGAADRRAIMRATVAYCISGQAIKIATAELAGEIVEKPFADAPHQEGVPFRKIFAVDGNPPMPYWQFEERKGTHGMLSHRQKAFGQIFDEIERLAR